MSVNAWNASLYDQKHAFVSEYGKSLLSILDPQAGENILDIGCGTGHLSSEIAQVGASVVGIDSSASMIETARKSYPGLDFRVEDARTFVLPAHFDAIFSNAALHWIPEAERVVCNLAVSLKPGGRFVLEMGGKGNIAQLVEATRQSVRELMQREIETPWYFPSIGEYTPILERYGLLVRSAILFDRPTPLEDGADGVRTWLTMFGEQMLRDVPAEMKSVVLARIEEKLRPTFFKSDRWVIGYCRLRLVAYKQ